MKKKENMDNATPNTPETDATEQNLPETEKDLESASGAADEATAVDEAGIAEWQAALETAVRQRDEYLDSLRRAQADFQNFKRRNQTAHADGYEEGVREVLAAMLPAIDNLERAIEAAQKHDGGDALVDGVKMTLNMLLEGMKRFGFEEVPALGEAFDPELHNAVMRETSDDPGKVLEVFQKGYRVKDKIIRYAMVKVAVE